MSVLQAPLPDLTSVYPSGVRSLPCRLCSHLPDTQPWPYSSGKCCFYFVTVPLLGPRSGSPKSTLLPIPALFSALQTLSLITLPDQAPPHLPPGVLWPSISHVSRSRGLRGPARAPGPLQTPLSGGGGAAGHMPPLPLETQAVPHTLSRAAVCPQLSWWKCSHDVNYTNAILWSLGENQAANPHGSVPWCLERTGPTNTGCFLFPFPALTRVGPVNLAGS